MAMADNDDADFGIAFVAFTGTPADPYTGGTNLGIVAHGDLTGATAVLTGATLATAGSYTVHAILSPTPTDGTCRPTAMTTVTVDGTCCTTGTNTFTGADGDWNIPENWSSTCVPTSPYTGDLTINMPVETSTIGAFVLNGNLTVASGGTFDHDDTNTFVVDGTIMISTGGIMKNSNVISATGGLTNTGTYSGGGTFEGDFTNNGTFNIGDN